MSPFVRILTICATGALTALLMTGAADAAAAVSEDCTPYSHESFPKDSVWVRITGPISEARHTSKDTALDLESELLVFGIRPDGVLIQNKQSRFPRLLPWKVLANNEISTDGRRTWRSACAD